MRCGRRKAGLGRGTGVGVVGLALLLGACSAPEPSPASRRAGASGEISIRGLEYRSTGQETRVATDSVLIRKRRFGAFSINPFREAVVEHAQLRISAWEDPEGGPTAARQGKREQLREAIDGLFELHRMGMLTRVLISDLSIELVSTDGTAFQVMASRASANSHRTAVELAGVLLVARSGDRLRASEAEVLDGGRRLRIHGRYQLERDGRQTFGRDADFTLVAGGQLIREPS